MLKDANLVAVIDREQKIITFYKRGEDFHFHASDAIMKVTGYEENQDRLILVGQEIQMRKLPAGLLSKEYINEFNLKKEYEEFERVDVPFKKLSLKWPFVHTELKERAIVEDKWYSTKHRVDAVIEVSRSDYSICDYSGSFLTPEKEAEDK